MCGIGLLSSFPTATDQGSSDDDLLLYWNRRLSETLASRGPDVPRGQRHFPSGNVATTKNGGSNALRELVPAATAAAGQWSATLHASVLHMRGRHPVEQPASFLVARASAGSQPARDCALCWNGECYTYYRDEMGGCVVDGDSTISDNHAGGGNMVELISTTTDEERSDTILVTELVCDAVARSQTFGTGEHEAIADAIGQIHGEFSFILFVPSSASEEGSAPPPAGSPIEPNSHQCRGGYIYYGRDRLGRRSLVVNRSFGGVVVLSSVAVVDPFSAEGITSRTMDEAWEEVPPGIVYRLNARTGEETSFSMPRFVNEEVLDMTIPPVPTWETPQHADEASKQSTTIVDGALTHKGAEVAANGLVKLLDMAVKRRVAWAPLPNPQTTDASVAVLFSGGIDSVVLAALSHRHIPPDQMIDLINVSFHNDADLANGTATPPSPDRLAAVLSYREMLRRFPERRWRFVAVDVPYKDVLDREGHILRLVSPLESTMDFNIGTAFWFAGRGKGRILGANEAEDARRGLENDETSPQEPLLRFAKADKSSDRKESSKTRPTCVREGCTRSAPGSGCVFGACKFCCGKLQGPVSSYLGKSARLCPAHNHGIVQKSNGANGTRKLPLEGREKSIPLARVGKRRSSPPHSAGNREGKADEISITSHAKVLLSGVGADEQMAGYGRHRTTFQRGGCEALRAELRTEVNRLWRRNLGRDDRCLSDHGKEARFPYLDEDVMAYLEALPIEQKCDFSRPPGEGDKLVLRDVARMIGVTECSTLVKRAIQFGSRIAKVSDKSRFGSGRKATGQKKIVADRGLESLQKST